MVPKVSQHCGIFFFGLAGRLFGISVCVATQFSVCVASSHVGLDVLKCLLSSGLVAYASESCLQSTDYGNAESVLRKHTQS